MICECGCGGTPPIAKETNSRYGHVKGKSLRFINGHNARLRKGDLHPNFKGEEAGYCATHERLRRSKGGICSTSGCTNQPTDLALIRGRGHLCDASGQFAGLAYSDQREDYIELCHSCHVSYDREEPPRRWRPRTQPV